MKAVGSPLVEIYEADYSTVPALSPEELAARDAKGRDLPRLAAEIRQAMHEAAEALDFERAAELRDRLHALESGADPGGATPGRGGKPAAAVASAGARRGRGGSARGAGRRRAPG